MPHHHCVVFLAGEDGGDGMMVYELIEEFIACNIVETRHLRFIYPESEHISIRWINFLRFPNNSVSSDVPSPRHMLEQSCRA